MRLFLICGLMAATGASWAVKDWQPLYEPVEGAGIPCRVMKPLNFDYAKKYPVIVSLHGAGGRGKDNRKQLKPWNQQLAENERRASFPCYVVAPQASDLWNENDLKQIQSVIKDLPSVNMSRIYILGHSMGGHGTYIFIQLAPDYFAAAAPSAGAGRKQTEAFIDPVKIKDIPIWAFHGDQDKVCPFEKQQQIFDDLKKLGGNMKLTIWEGGNHGVSDKFIPGAKNGTTLHSSDLCSKETDFMTWLFSQARNQ
jgi:predicted peptidase